MPGLVVVVIAEGELLHVVEGFPAHIGLDIDAEHVAPIGDDNHKTGVHRIADEKRDRGDHDQEPLLCHQQPVDEQLDRHGKAEFQQAGKNRTAEIENEQSLVGAVIGKETGKHYGISGMWFGDRTPARK
ncbi:hypothetical protein D3C80_1397350 [compost metagenome]